MKHFLAFVVLLVLAAITSAFPIADRLERAGAGAGDENTPKEKSIRRRQYFVPYGYVYYPDQGQPSTNINNQASAGLVGVNSVGSGSGVLGIGLFNNWNVFRVSKNQGDEREGAFRFAPSSPLLPLTGRVTAVALCSIHIYRITKRTQSAVVVDVTAMTHERFWRPLLRLVQSPNISVTSNYLVTG